MHPFIAIAAGVLTALALNAGALRAAAHQGHLYGTVETLGGETYTGILRWGGEEAFWDDLFNAGKEDRPWDRYATRRERKGFTLFGIRIGWEDGDWGRQLVVRFGDIEEVRVDREELLMKNGSVVPFGGGSNDVGADVTVWDAGLGEVEVRWDRIRRVSFASVPAGAQPPGSRLYGKLTTYRGSFEGFVQWDGDECLSIDELDGETRDGDLSIPFAQIRAIEKNNRRGAWVELADGRRLLLEDTNDVDDSTYGIFVEDPRYGRVLVSWDAFERVEFQEGRGSGRGFADYRPQPKELPGTVTTKDGQTHRGAIVLDLDEAEGWELVNGDLDEVEYYIPIVRVASITPRGYDSSLVVLRDGTQLTLEDSPDVSEEGDGVLVVVSGGSPVYVAWEDVASIHYD